MGLPQELRTLVHDSVAVLGEVIAREVGEELFATIENLRREMVELRGLSSLESESKELHRQLAILSRLSGEQQRAVARAFVMMLEVINACENAYRSYRLNEQASRHAEGRVDNPDLESIVFVLTAHPTEARSPLNIAAFHHVQSVLMRGLGGENVRHDLRHWLEIAWRTPIVRERAPHVRDEAEHIYSMLFRDDVLFDLLRAKPSDLAFSIRSWVGGDKDGHPGVNEITLRESLQLSRSRLLAVIRDEMKSTREALLLISSKSLLRALHQLELSARALAQLKAGDGRRVAAFQKSLQKIENAYALQVGEVHPSLRRMRDIVAMFPGLSIPLEVRESSDVLMSESSSGRKKLAIYKMLKVVSEISRGGDPRWYVRGFVISMAESAEHIRTAATFEKDVFGHVPIPVIPLFEEASSLKNSENIMHEALHLPLIYASAQKYWQSRIEMMVGYSDSAKESGVLASRVAIASAFPPLESLCHERKLTPIFFHGSGGSVDRGGGSIEDQTAWWPKAALHNYKVTIQGEMVERTLATPAIAYRQIETICESVGEALTNKTHEPYRCHRAVADFAEKTARRYRETVASPDFLEMVGLATPYSYLRYLKIGSRPAKRTKEFTVKGLRAIPWVLCWTQTRTLFPTWWGVGSAWKDLSEEQRDELRNAFAKDPVFTSYVKALGFTLAKVRMPIWRLYLSESPLEKSKADYFFRTFADEFALTQKCFAELTGGREWLWFRPWLGESIALRSSMIHPLNLLQILAEKRKDLPLLRMSITGISSGMLTTG